MNRPTRFTRIQSTGTVSFLTLACAIACYSSSACNQPESSSPQHHDGVNEAATANNNGDVEHGLHITQNQRLSAIMGELRSLDFDGLARQASAGGPADRRLASAAHQAAELAADARLMPHLFKSEEFTGEQRRAFDQLAVQLQIQCMELRDAASANNAAATRAKLDQVVRTCNDCHTAFRGPVMASADVDDVPY